MAMRPKGTRKRSGSGKSRQYQGRPLGDSIQTVFYASGPCMVVRQGPRRAAGALLLAFIVGLVLSVSTASAAPRVLAVPAGAILINFDIPVEAAPAAYFQRPAQMPIPCSEDPA